MELSGDFVAGEAVLVESLELGLLLFGELFHCCLRAGAFAKAVAAASEMVEWFFLIHGEVGQVY